MKRYLRTAFVSLFICVLIFGFVSTSFAAPTLRIHFRRYLTGGTESVDNIPYATLMDAAYNGHYCITVNDSKVLYIHRFNDSSSEVEASPDPIKPDDAGAGDGRWELITAIGIAGDSWLDDTKGDGDTNNLWSVDKIFDQLALKVSNTLAVDVDLNTKYIEQAETQITDADGATPDLAGSGTYFEFYDSTADVDTITGFLNFNADTTYWYRFEDAYWIIDFSGTNLKGHNGIDWEPVAGDAMACRSHDGTVIDCIISRPSAMSFSQYYGMPFDSTPNSDLSWSGSEQEYENGSGGALSQGDLVYLRSDGAGQEGAIWPWDADLATYKNYKPIGIVIESGGIADGVTGTVGTKWGTWRDDSLNFTDNTDEGKTVYGTTTAGSYGVTAPSVAGDIVCAIGIVSDDDIIEFNFALSTSVEVPVP